MNKYTIPVPKITARQIAKNENCNLSLIYQKIRNGEFGDYWRGPVRVSLHAYLDWQERTRLNRDKKFKLDGRRANPPKNLLPRTAPVPGLNDSKDGR